MEMKGDTWWYNGDIMEICSWNVPYLILFGCSWSEKWGIDLQVVSRAMSRKLFVVWFIYWTTSWTQGSQNPSACSPRDNANHRLQIHDSDQPAGHLVRFIFVAATMSITFVFVAVFHRLWGGTMCSSVCEKNTEERDDDEPLVCVFMRVNLWFMIINSHTRNQPICLKNMKSLFDTVSGRNPAPVGKS